MYKGVNNLKNLDFVKNCKFNLLNINIKNFIFNK